jgi:hypothetical protein
MLRLRRSRGDAQHERALKSQEGLPFALSPSASSGQATRSEVEGQMRLVLSPLQKGFLYTAAVAFFLPAERAERLAGALRQRQRSLRQVLMKTEAAVLPDLHGQLLFTLSRCQKRPPAVFLAGAARFTATATEHPQMALGKEGKRHLRVVG